MPHCPKIWHRCRHCPKLRSIHHIRRGVDCFGAVCVCGGKTYLSFTYFLGAVPENNYTPSQPFKLVINADHTSGAEPGYMKLMIPCGDADSPLIDTAEQ